MKFRIPLPFGNWEVRGHRPDTTEPEVPGQISLGRIKIAPKRPQTRTAPPQLTLQLPTFNFQASVAVSVQESAARQWLPQPLADAARAFQAATTDAERTAASRTAIRLYTRNSNSINPSLRAGDRSPLLVALRDAIDWGIVHAPDYGKARPTLYRRVDLPQSVLNAAQSTGRLTDIAFMSTTSSPPMPGAHSSRNTLMHIKARWAADVSGISPDPHFREHLLPSGSTLRIDSFEASSGDDDSLYSDDGVMRYEIKATQIHPAHHR